MAQKKRKTAESSPMTMHSKACAVGRAQQAATNDTIACPPGVTGYVSEKISACCLVCQFVYQFVSLFVRTITSERLNIGR